MPSISTAKCFFLSVKSVKLISQGKVILICLMPSGGNCIHLEYIPASGAGNLIIVVMSILLPVLLDVIYIDSFLSVWGF